MDTSPSELIFLDGTVSAVIYRNEENGYTILRLETTDEGGGGHRGGHHARDKPREGLSVHGQWTRHSTYGEQFKAEIVERRMPVGEKALLEYLASGAIKGIGAATARRPLDVFGEDILTVIEEDPQQLTKVRGISPSGRRPSTSPSACGCPCAGRWTSSPPTACPLSIATPLYRRYGDLALNALRANPYLLMEDPLFVSFPAADKLAMDLGFSPEDPLRLEAGILYTLAHNLDNGHVFLPYAKLLAAAQRPLEGRPTPWRPASRTCWTRGGSSGTPSPGRTPATWTSSTTVRPMWPTPCWPWTGGALPPRRFGGPAGADPAGPGPHLRPPPGGGGENRRPAAGDAPLTGGRAPARPPLSGDPGLFDHLGRARPSPPPPGGQPSAWQRPAGRRPPPSTASWKPGTTATPAASPSPTTNGSPWTPTR